MDKLISITVIFLLVWIIVSGAVSIMDLNDGRITLVVNQLVK
jgi:hypothetical protein